MREKRIFFMRHGERCDFLMGNKGSGFMKTAFDLNGKYTPFDINLPRTLPKRADGWQAFANDTPLTEIGYLEAKLTGRAYKDKHIVIDHIYCSPALRCVQTAVGFIKGTGSNLTFSIEPGLFEYMMWCRHGRPTWMQPSEFVKLGYPIQSENEQIIKANELVIEETLDDFYRRSELVIRELCQRHPNGNILFVVHGPSMEACTRLITGGKPRNNEEFFHVLLQSSYLANIELKEAKPGRFMFNGRPVPPLTVSAISTFNPRILEMTDEEVREEIRKKNIDRPKYN